MLCEDFNKQIFLLQFLNSHRRSEKNIAVINHYRFNSFAQRRLTSACCSRRHFLLNTYIWELHTKKPSRQWLWLFFIWECKYFCATHKLYANKRSRNFCVVMLLPKMRILNFYHIWVKLIVNKILSRLKNFKSYFNNLIFMSL